MSHTHPLSLATFLTTYCFIRPFHAAVGITTCRLLIHLRKFSENHLEGDIHISKLPDLENMTWDEAIIYPGEPLGFRHSEDSDATLSVDDHSIPPSWRVDDEESLVNHPEAATAPG